MTNKKKERSTDDEAVAAKAFLDGVADLMQKHQIQPGMAFSLFGFFGRNIIDYEVEELGGDRNDLVLEAMKAFTVGLGVKGGFVEMKGEMAEQVKAQFERQHDDKPLQ
jgi:hypothetical protein